MMFAGIIVAQAGNVIACRTNKQSVFKTSFKTNKWIIVGILTQLFILALLIYVPFLQKIFSTTALTAADWAFLALLPVTVILVDEIRKFFARRFSKVKGT